MKKTLLALALTAITMPMPTFAGCPLTEAKFRSIFLSAPQQIRPKVDLSKYTINGCSVHIYDGIAGTKVVLPTIVNNFHLVLAVGATFEFKKSAAYVPMLLNSNLEAGEVRGVNAPYLIMRDSVIHGDSSVSWITMPFAKLTHSSISSYSMQSVGYLDTVDLHGAHLLNSSLDGNVLNTLDMRGASAVSSNFNGISTPGNSRQLLIDGRTNLVGNTFRGDMTSVNRPDFIKTKSFCGNKFVGTYTLTRKSIKEQWKKTMLTMKDYPTDHNCPK